jgi:hypothetical protein
MSCLWLEHAGAWQARALAGGRVLAGDELALAGIAFVPLPRGQAALLVRPGVRVRVNGEPVFGGVRLLEHKDEVLIGARRVVFSGEATPVVTTFTAAGQRPPVCPVCRGPVREGTQAVQCPGCGRWFHQQDAKTCWTYAATCRFCNHPTSFSAETCWRPDQEESVA